MKKVYKIALLYGDFVCDNVKTYEYATMEEMQNDLKEILIREEKAILGRNFCYIELSMLEQDENGENEKVYTFCEIRIRWGRDYEKFIK